MNICKFLRLHICDHLTQVVVSGPVEVQLLVHIRVKFFRQSVFKFFWSLFRWAICVIFLLLRALFVDCIVELAANIFKQLSCNLFAALALLLQVFYLTIISLNPVIFWLQYAVFKRATWALFRAFLKSQNFFFTPFTLICNVLQEIFDALDHVGCWLIVVISHAHDLFSQTVFNLWLFLRFLILPCAILIVCKYIQLSNTSKCPII